MLDIYFFPRFAEVKCSNTDLFDTKNWTGLGGTTENIHGKCRDDVECPDGAGDETDLKQSVGELESETVPVTRPSGGRVRSLHFTSDECQVGHYDISI